MFDCCIDVSVEDEDVIKDVDPTDIKFRSAKGYSPMKIDLVSDGVITLTVVLWTCHEPCPLCNFATSWQDDSHCCCSRNFSNDSAWRARS